MPELKEKVIDSTEARAELHKLVDQLAGLADQESDAAIDLLIDFATLGQCILDTDGKVDLSEIVKSLEEEPENFICENCDKHEVHAEQVVN